MSATTSASSGRRYGIHRVCRVWERTRSALYARRLVRDVGSRASARRAAGRSRPARTNNCWRPFAPTSLGRRSRARAIGRCTRGCGYWMGSASPAPVCCA